MTYNDLTTNQKHLMDLAFMRHNEGKGYQKRLPPPTIFDLDFDDEKDKQVEEDFNWLLNNDLIHVESDLGNKVIYCLSDIGLELMLKK